MEMIDNLKVSHFFMKLMAGLTIDEIREEVIRQSIGGNIKYVDLNPIDKEQCDEIVAEFSFVSKMFDETATARAILTKKAYDALLAQGFSRSEAATIVAAQPIEVRPIKA